MYCINCGFQLPDGANFCSHCGHQCNNNANIRAVKENNLNIAKYVGLYFKEEAGGRHLEITDKGVKIYREKSWFNIPFNNFIPFDKMIAINIRYPSFGLPSGVLTIKTTGGGLDTYYLNSSKFEDAAIIGSDPNTICFLKKNADTVQKIYNALLDIQQNYSK